MQQERTPVQAAFVTLHTHSLTCPQCRPVWVDGRPTFQDCPEELRLYEVWRALDRGRRS